MNPLGVVSLACFAGGTLAALASAAAWKIGGGDNTVAFRLWAICGVLLALGTITIDNI
jgi:hypothetical protein